jgi:hypothetical protein
MLCLNLLGNLKSKLLEPNTSEIIIFI